MENSKIELEIWISEILYFLVTVKGLYERLRKEHIELSLNFSNGESGISEIVLHEHNAYQLKSIGYAVYCYGDRRVRVYVLLDSEGLGACKISAYRASTYAALRGAR